ncbi:phage minor head protein [Neisseria sp. S1]|uniref:phage minor head protein n=1 Tax=Neisseria sp. S1 TaxID=3318354 RepID=UPI003A83C333
MPSINFALGLKPAKAIEWLKAKNVTAENYRNLTASEIAKVYTIARMTDLDMLHDIKQSMITAKENGLSYQDWRKDILQHLQNKGWLHPNGHNGQDIIDPKTGEVFGPPRRLENIYRTNMQSAYQAGRYQTYMGNIDNRPYWMYDAVGDHRTRPAHAAMDGLVYRYDDPFWATFYPPNGYRCRCTVVALSERDVARNGYIVGQSTEQNLIETHKVYNKQGDSYLTKAYKAPDGRLYTTDRGFDYNAGRMNYRPNLDNYDRGLAHQFARVEMSGAEFKASFKQLAAEFDEVKKRLSINGKPDSQQQIAIRNTLSRRLKFAAGVLSEQTQALAGIGRRTVWLSDDTLIKQMDSRSGQDFGLDYYEYLPELLHHPENVIADGKHIVLTGRYQDSLLLAVVKYIADADEVYLQSYRITSGKEIEKLIQRVKTK